MLSADHLPEMRGRGWADGELFLLRHLDLYVVGETTVALNIPGLANGRVAAVVKITR